MFRNLFRGKVTDTDIESKNHLESDSMITGLPSQSYSKKLTKKRKSGGSIWSRSIAVTAGSLVVAGTLGLGLGVGSATEAHASVGIGEGSGNSSSNSGSSTNTVSWKTERASGGYNAFQQAALSMGYYHGPQDSFTSRGHSGLESTMRSYMGTSHANSVINVCHNTDDTTSFTSWNYANNNHPSPPVPSRPNMVFFGSAQHNDSTQYSPTPASQLPSELWQGYLDAGGQYPSGNMEFICVDKVDLERSITRDFYQYRYSSSSSSSESDSITFNGVNRVSTEILPAYDPSNELRRQNIRPQDTAYGDLLSEIAAGDHDHRSFDNMVNRIQNALPSSGESVSSVIDLSAHNISVLSSSGKGGVLDWTSSEGEASIELTETEHRTEHNYERRQWTCEFTGPSSDSNSQLTTSNGRTISHFTQTQNASNDRMRNYYSPLNSHTQRFLNADCSSGSWGNINSPSDDVNHTIDLGSPEREPMQQVSHWQSIGAVCNVEGMQNATSTANNYTPGNTSVNVFNENADGSASRDDNIFVYAQSPKTDRMITYWGNGNHSDSELAATGTDEFYQNGCVGVPGISTDGPDGDNPSGSDPGNPPHNSADLVCRPDDFVHAVGDSNRYSMDFLDGANNPPSGVNSGSDDSNFYFGPGSSGNNGNSKSVISFVRDNDYNQISLQPAVADASRSDAIQTINNSGNPVSTVVERWAQGTPGIVSGTGSTFTFAPGTGANGRDGGNMFEGNGNDTTALSRTVAQIDRPENLFRAAANWASESGQPETLAFSWNYEARPNVYMPVRHWPNMSRTWTTSNSTDARTRSSQSYNTGSRVNNGVRYAADESLEIRCYTTFNDGSGYDGSYVIDDEAYENGDSIQDDLGSNSSRLANAPWNLQIEFSRQVGER